MCLCVQSLWVAKTKLFYFCCMVNWVLFEFLTVPCQVMLSHCFCVFLILLQHCQQSYIFLRKNKVLRPLLLCVHSKFVISFFLYVQDNLDNAFTFYWKKNLSSQQPLDSLRIYLIQEYIQIVCECFCFPKFLLIFLFCYFCESFKP